MKKVSVIIPFYRHVDWLCEAIESVLSQTYNNIEIILVNDGSKENMSDFLSKYGNKIIYIEQANAGPAAARNKGIKKATGDYIAFEDSDDIWLPNKLEEQVALMEKTGAMWSHVGFNYWWPDTGRINTVDSSRDYGDIYLQRHISTKIATPAVMLDKSIYNEHDFYFPEDIRNGEDDQLYTKLAKFYPIAFVQEPLVNVRMRGDNSQSHAIERFQLRANNYNQWKKEGEKLSLMTRIIYAHYRIYSKLFGTQVTPFKEKIAKIFWILPYSYERIYVRYLFHHTSKDEKYIKRKQIIVDK